MPDPQNAPEAATERRPSRPPLLTVLTVILALETVLVVGVACWLVYELLTQKPESYPSAVAIAVLVLLAAAWLIATLVGILRLRSWARASALTIQILQLAVAIGCFQGFYARPDVGWALLVPAVVAGVLAVSPAVVRATARNMEQHE
ncbi:hypothetical protein SAMN04515691_2819 [Leifsonia sp. 98AMF]|uniref:hypothetical protein n=1 Tax=unclassified Leifsonia TaxID=2663824 RepID=UPI00087B68CC|nr:MULTISPECIES: hypothetical protein [unclassified Leifsonia]SDH19815.1 hypothetical protein SAMN04515690_1197 [Leifsonia sp. 197AMF]SDJ18887.1 hypothetical protein SAMN04515684_2585 [Leifsonia sp. 466MF]SDJ47652.1 hypothetical protein SAMN04515683_0158 [Leifsonia sp. 157MF]SDN40182.1 hypothetical protein SAMN04515686_0769 [Leifsonia sp. 509MF]SEM80585.1 hypothetical protein SAMN04515685_0146 [Leifsonia sp. 467MF]